MEFLLTILFPLILLAAAWNCARADSWAERFVQWVAFAMVGLGIFAVAALVYFQLTSLGGAPQPQSGTAPSSLGQSWLGILSPLVALLAGGLGGAVFSYRVYLLPKERASTTLHLLREAMRLQALEEAWIVDAIDTSGKPAPEVARQAVLSWETPLDENKPTGADGCYLRKVEVRGVLDEPRWRCSEDDPFYGRLDLRRAWIVRDRLSSDDRGRDPRPALLSSVAIEELVAWMEQVGAARKGGLLTDHDAKFL